MLNITPVPSHHAIALWQLRGRRLRRTTFPNSDRWLDHCQAPTGRLGLTTNLRQPDRRTIDIRLHDGTHG